MTIDLTIHWPQAIMVAALFGLFADSILHSGKTREVKVKPPGHALMFVALFSGLLYWGGFFR